MAKLPQREVGAEPPDLLTLQCELAQYSRPVIVLVRDTHSNGVPALRRTYTCPRCLPSVLYARPKMRLAALHPWGPRMALRISDPAEALKVLCHPEQFVSAKHLQDERVEGPIVWRFASVRPESGTVSCRLCRPPHKTVRDDADWRSQKVQHRGNPRTRP